MSFKIELEQEEDGRWIAEIPSLPGVMVYGATRDEALHKVMALAFRVLADQAEEDTSTPNDKFTPFFCHRVSNWPSSKARKVSRAFLTIGWKKNQIKRVTVRT
jgi:predicted RNase H-like HicB family nuclease